MRTEADAGKWGGGDRREGSKRREVTEGSENRINRYTF